jgi:hypothetical protein
MRMKKILLRGVALCCVCLATWFVTRSLMAQVGGKRAANTAAVAPSDPIAGKWAVTLPDGTPPPAQPQLPPGAIALPDRPISVIRLTGYRQTLVGNQLKVETSVDIVDRRAGVSYVWVLTVAPDGGGEPGGPPTIKMVYDQQVFDVAATGHGSPTFSEVIELPSGHHFVQVGLYHFRKDEDLSFLDDLQAAYTKCAAGGSGAVNVP